MRDLLAILGRHPTFAILVNDGGGLVIGASHELEPGQERWLRGLGSPINEVTSAVLGGASVGVKGQHMGLYPLRDGKNGPVVGALAVSPISTIEDGRDETLKLAAALGRILADALAHQDLADKVAYDRVRAGDVSTCEK